MGLMLQNCRAVLQNFCLEQVAGHCFTNQRVNGTFYNGALWRSSSVW